MCCELFFFPHFLFRGFFADPTHSFTLVPVRMRVKQELKQELLFYHYTSCTTKFLNGISVSAWLLSTGLHWGSPEWRPALWLSCTGVSLLSRNNTTKRISLVWTSTPPFPGTWTQFYEKRKGTDQKCSNERENATAGTTHNSTDPPAGLQLQSQGSVCYTWC